MMIKRWLKEAEEYNAKLNREDIYYWYGPIILANGELSDECYHVYQKIWDIKNFKKLVFTQRMPIEQLRIYFEKVKEGEADERNKAIFKET